MSKGRGQTYVLPYRERLPEVDIGSHVSPAVKLDDLDPTSVSHLYVRPQRSRVQLPCQTYAVDRVGAKVLGVDSEPTQDAVAVWRKVDGRANLPRQFRALEKLGGGKHGYRVVSP